MHLTYENYHFDTTGKWLTTIQGLLTKSNDHPFSLTFNLPTQMSNLKKIYLKSIELPVGFTNIRAENHSNTLTISVNTISCTITIPPQSYTIIQLINAINNAIVDSNIYTDDNSNLLPIFSINGQVINVTATNSIFASILFTSNTILTTVILGFSYYFQNPLSNNITAPANYNIYYDTYLCMYFPYVNHKSSSVNLGQISFKIPYNGYQNSIFYSVENTQFSQYIELTEENFVLGSLKIVVNDKYGYNINNNGLDWSFTLGFEQDKTHKKMQYHLPPEYYQSDDFN